MSIFWPDQLFSGFFSTSMPAYKKGHTQVNKATNINLSHFITISMKGVLIIYFSKIGIFRHFLQERNWIAEKIDKFCVPDISDVTLISLPCVTFCHFFNQCPRSPVTYPLNSSLGNCNNFIIVTFISLKSGKPMAMIFEFCKLVTEFVQKWYWMLESCGCFD